MEVRIKQCKQLMKLYVENKKPLFVHGHMGIGKSDLARQVAREIAKEKGKEYAEGIINVVVSQQGVETVEVKHEYKDSDKHYFLMDVRITSLDPSDLRGIPFPDGNTVKWLTPNWLPKMGEGILFFDEMNLAPGSIQASAYQLVLDRRIGEYELPSGWSILAAGNLDSDRANIFPMAAPLKNRFSHCELMPPSTDEWIDWALENNINPTIIGMVSFKQSLLHKFDPNSKDNAFPTHRTWALASKMLESLTDDDWKDNKNEVPYAVQVVASCVGEGTAMEFFGFHKLKKSINVKDLLAHPEKVREIEDLGTRHSLVSALAEVYKADNKTMNNILQVMSYMDAEFGVFLMRIMQGMRPKNFQQDLNKSKEWDSLHIQYGKYLL